MTRIALIGAGLHGRNHAIAIRNMRKGGKNIEIALVIDSVESKAAALSAEFKIPNFGTINMLKKVNVDAVDICSPTETHLPIAKVCATLGLPTLIEKPLASNLKDANKIIEIFKKINVNLFVGHTTRFDPSILPFVQRVLAGEIGKVGLVEVRHWQGYSWTNGWKAWQHNSRNSGGRLIHLGIHDIDLACWMVNSKPIKVRAVGTPLVSSRKASWSSFSAQITFENSSIALITGNWDIKPANYWRKYVAIVGSEGQISYDSNDDEISLTNFNTEPIGYEMSIQNQLSHWLDCVNGTDKPFVTIEQAQISLATAFAAQNSADRAGALVEISAS